LIKKPLIVLVCALLGGVMVWAGHLFLFSMFMLYDDEGYVLISLRDFGLHGSLYNQVFSQYGPAFYLIYDTLHKLVGFAWTNTTGRWITLFNWTGTAFFCALLVRRARGSWPLVFYVFAAVFSFLWVMVREPMHPGSTITLIVAATAWLGWEMLQAGRINGFAIVTGIAGALLALIKINVGVFLILSSVLWLVLSLPSDLVRRRHLLFAALGLLFPFALMHTLIADGWVQIFAMSAGLAIMGAVLAAVPAAQLQPGRPRTWGWFAGTGLAVVAGVTCLMLPRDTNLVELWQGVILAPLKHPGVYAFALEWYPGSIWTALGVVVLILLARRRPQDARITQLIAWVRIVAAIAYVLFGLHNSIVTQSALGLSYGLPLAGLFAWPLDPKQPANQARAWLALLMVFQSLHAFPVAGSQLNWGVFLWIPLMALGFQEALDVVCLPRPKIGRWARVTLFACLIILTAHLTRSFVELANFARSGGEALEQPGAEAIYMPANYSSALRVLAENARVHGDMLFSLPGSYSLNLWSGVDTPTLANATHWFSLLTRAQQEEIIHRLEASRRPVFIVQHKILMDLMKSDFHPQGPLMDYLRANFHRSFAIERDSLWVRNGRSIAPLSTATLSEPVSDKRELNLTMAPHAGKVARAEIWITVGLPWRKLTLDASQTKVSITPLNLDGTVSGPAHAADWPWSNDQIARITLTFSTPSSLPPINVLEVVLFTADNQKVASARILPFDSLELPPEKHADPATATAAL